MFNLLKNNKIKNKMEDVIIFEFKPFRDTYKMITFALCVGMIYPNPSIDKCRVISILLILISIAPLAAIIFIDMYVSWLERDIVNIIRHSTVVGPFLGGFFKMFLMFHKRHRARSILDEIDEDYESYNHFTTEYRNIAATSVQHSLVYCEKAWVIVVTFCVMTFPAMAIMQNFYNFAFKNDPQKYMIHDLNKPFDAKESRFESPYFEFMFAYMFYSSIMYVVNFIGYDGFFELCINHACLKMELYCKALEDALAGPMDVMHARIVAVIREQNRMFQFVDALQDTFNIWLGIIFLATMIQICTCMYHITEGYGFDLRYMIFVFGAIVHIYLPCRYASKLKTLSAETGTKIYSSGWENVPSQSIRKMVLFMVARGQIPIEITAFNMLVFDMELFVSIMQTSYSMFTLLRS